MVSGYVVVKERGGQWRTVLLNAAQMDFVTRFLGGSGAKLYHANEQILG